MIIYSDDALLVVDKPAGIPVLPEGWEREAPYLAAQLEAQFGKLWIVHRLDKVTSGVIVFARTAAAHRTLSLLFETRAVHKVYHAIVVGNPPWNEHTARHPLRINVGHSHRTAVDHGKGKPSETTFQVLECHNGYALLAATPATGRTHQIRAHISALGFPILGDSLYGAPLTELILRPALHAFSLEFEFGEKPLSFTAPYPEDFETALAALKRSAKTSGSLISRHK
jgi:RluA family pseudouridine synthase